MKCYSAERKAAGIQKMMPPYNTPIPELAAETGISASTLYAWRKQGRESAISVPADGKNPEKWSSEVKFAIVLVAAALNEAKLGEYCRRKILYVEQIEAWRKACLQANANNAAQAKAQQEQTKQDRRHIKRLEQELRHKDKALAEAATIVEYHKQVHRGAQALHPHRWSGAFRKWGLPENVCLNPEKERPDLSKAT